MSGPNAGSPTSWAKPQQDQKSIRPGAHAINANTAAATAGEGSDMEDEGQSTGSRMPSGKHASQPCHCCGDCCSLWAGCILQLQHVPCCSNIQKAEFEDKSSNGKTMSAVELNRQDISSKVLQQTMNLCWHGSLSSALASWWTKPQTEAALSTRQQCHAATVRHGSSSQAFNFLWQQLHVGTAAGCQLSFEQPQS